MSKTDSMLEAVLRERAFESLAIKRFDRECYLVVKTGEAAHVLADEAVLPIKFRYAWQIREWLQQKFQIVADDISVLPHKYK